MGAKQPEKIFQEHVIKYFDSEGFLAVKQEGILAGWPDIYATNGISFHIECKVGNNQATKLQEYWLKKLSSRGANCCVARNLDQVKYFVNEVCFNKLGVFCVFKDESLVIHEYRHLKSL